MSISVGIDGRLVKQTGVGRYTRNLYSQLKKVDKKNHYFLLQPKIAWHSLSEQLVFPLWLLFQEVDLVHFPYFSFPLLSPKKFIITIHDLIPWYFKTGKASTLPGWLYSLKHFFYKQLLYWGARRACQIIAVSQSTKKEIIKCLKVNPDKVVVIYEGAQIKPTAEKTKYKDYLLYVGNAYPHKNLEKLIEAFEKLDNKVVKLILVGPDDYFYQRLKKKLKDKDIGKRIVFYGPVSDGKLAALYSQAIALVNPSLMEGFGLPGLEAMAVGCPVVCSEIEVFKEVYGSSALYFNPHKAEDIKDSLEKIIKNGREREELIKKGKQQVSKYSWEKSARETLKVYESCL